MNLTEISELHSRLCKPGYGTVTADELEFIQSLIAIHTPKSFVEIGMASGLSTGFIARFMEDQGGGRLVSLDHDDTFFGDPKKPNGFLFPEIYQGDAVSSELIKFKTALDIHEIDGEFGMAFIDANHHHPWPALDMMALYPKMTGPRIMLHHDLRLYMAPNKVQGIGPKYLFDQFPESHRQRSAANEGNMFAVDLTLDQGAFEAILTALFKLPWSTQSPLRANILEKIEAVLKRDYSPTLYDHFLRCNDENASLAAAPAKIEMLLRNLDRMNNQIDRLQANLVQMNGRIGRLDNKTEHIRTMVQKGMLRRVLNRITGRR